MKKKKTPSKPPTQKHILRRENRMTFLFNDEEMKAFNRFVAKYKIQNQSRFIRETVMIAILKQMEEDHPTLFD